MISLFQSKKDVTSSSVDEKPNEDDKVYLQGSMVIIIIAMANFFSFRLATGVKTQDVLIVRGLKYTCTLVVNNFNTCSGPVFV